MTSRIAPSILAALGFGAAACGGGTEGQARPSETAHSSSMALSADGKTLAVVNPEADSLSVVDVEKRTLIREIVLAPARPTTDASGAYTPAVLPRSVALSKDGGTAYVTGERSGALYFVDVDKGTVTRTVPVGSEPVGLVVSPDGASIDVACSQDATVVEIDAGSGRVVRTVPVSSEPWALAWSGDGSELLVTHFMGGIDAIDPAKGTVTATWVVPDVAPRGDRRLAHGQVRGLYDVAARASSDEVWVAHALLGTDTPQPDLDFESTAFPALTILHEGGNYEQTLSTDASDIDGVDGAFADVVSGPHAVAFTHDGRFALLVASNSEDVLVVDANARVESALVRPLPGSMPDGIVISADDRYAYVDERLSGDVAVVKLEASDGGGLSPAVEGAPISRWASDPMPAELRLGQQIFDSANSAKFPITTDHWIACATCHMEGRSDAVTWEFAQGPRDTPTNAGGVLGTGFLFRTADRNRISDYWHTVNVEQGGSFDPVLQKPLLDALTAYVNFAIPAPVAPTTDAALVSRGKTVFGDSDCASCHSGARYTDSGGGNPGLDLAGPILLHDVGTCVRSGFPDVAHNDVDGHPRAACDFDTPSLVGIASTPPYLHDGGAPTLRNAVLKMPKAPTTSDDLDALVEYLRSL